MTLRGAPANSANVVVGMSTEAADCAGVLDPDAPILWLQTTNAVTGQPVPAVIETGRSDSSGQMDSPILGPVSTANDLGSSADPRVLDFLFNVITRGNVVSSTAIDPGPPQILRREFLYDPTLPEIPLTIRYGLQDIGNPLVWRNYGTHLDGVTITAAAGAFVEVRFTGQSASFARYSEAFPFFANTGTHAGPQIRGVPRPALEGRPSYARQVVYLRVTNVGDPNTPQGSLPYTPLAFQVETIEEGGGLPVWGAQQTYYQRYFEQDDGSWQATWRDCQDDEGYDIGVVSKPGSKLPVQVVFPGTLTDTAAEIEVGDVFSFTPASIPDLVPTYNEESGFTLAHIIAEVTDPETGAVEQLERDAVTITFAHPLTPVHGDNTNYVSRFDRTAEQMLTVTIPRGVTSPVLQDARLTNKPLDIRLVCEGAQWDGVPALGIDEAAPRRSFEVIMPGSTLTDATMAISGSAPVTEALAFRSGRGFSFVAQDEGLGL